MFEPPLMHIGDIVTFGFEPFRPWYVRVWRRVREMFGHTYPPTRWVVLSEQTGRPGEIVEIAPLDPAEPRA